MTLDSGITSCHPSELILYYSSCESAEAMTKQMLVLIDIARAITPLPSILATRLAGRKFWEKLQAELEERGDDAVVLLSFNGVEVMDASFADEVFGTLAARRSRREKPLPPIIVGHANETCLENIQMALETRADREPPDRERLRNCVLPVLNGDDVNLVGKFEDHVLQSFDLLARRKSITARDLSDLSGLNLNAASTRLKTLADLGLALRTEVRDSQGKQYVYHALQ